MASAHKCQVAGNDPRSLRGAETLSEIVDALIGFVPHFVSRSFPFFSLLCVAVIIL